MPNLKLVVSDPADILNLCSSLHSKSGTQVQIKINNYLKAKTGSFVTFMIPLLKESEEAVVQVIGESVLDHELRFPFIDDSIQLAVKRRRSFKGTTKDLYTDLQNMLKTVINPLPDRYLNVPVPHPSQDIIALLVCLVDYDEIDNAEYMCTNLVQDCFRYCFGTVINSLAFEEEKRLKLQCQSLLLVARRLFSHLGHLPELLKEIMVEARRLTNAERCSLFLLDPDHQELVAKVFDGKDGKDEIRIQKDQGIAGHVVASGKLLNIRDAYKHPLFFKGMDEVTGFRTRNILCFPIRDEETVIGVAQLCNKIDGFHFDVFDEEVAEAFSIYCGISIMHSLVYKKIQDAQARSKLSNELMMYHMKVNDDDLKKVLFCDKSHKHPHFEDFDFSPRVLPIKEISCYACKMFEDLNMITTFHIKKHTLTRFLLFAKKSYRETPYHNWMHAFSVAHFSYLLLKNLKLIELGYLTSLEGLTLMVACICHDLDHRGTTNSFQMQSGTTLASLYSSEGSVMERHHLAQAICILNTEGCNIFDGLSQTDYTHSLDLLKEMILATDLAHHFKIFSEQQKLVENYQKDDPNHKRLFIALLMTCCDLSDQTKSWKVTKNIALLIYKEFFSQGDLEKSMGSRPLDMMDRDKANIPQLQIQFLSDIIIPLFDTIKGIFPESACLVEAARFNRDCWSRAVDLFADSWPEELSSLEILTDPELERQVLLSVVRS